MQAVTSCKMTKHGLQFFLIHLHSLMNPNESTVSCMHLLVQLNASGNHTDIAKQTNLCYNGFCAGARFTFICHTTSHQVSQL